MAILENLPPSLAEALANPPAKGNRNVWLFMVAKRACHVASRKKLRAFLLHVTSTWSDRDFTPEIDRAIARAYADSHSTFSILHSAFSPPPWPAFNPLAWERRKFHTPLFDARPLTSVSAEQAIDALYPPKSLLCMAIDTRSAFTQKREAWRGKEAGLQFLVSNPMSAATGRTQSGDTSARCLGNAAKTRLYQIVEFDRGTFDEQAAILSSLDSDLTPFVMAVHSGGKSIHGWFDVRKLPPHAQLRFFRHAVHLGADASLWDISKLVRLPGGRRDTGETQHILYFDPPTHP